MGGDDLAVPDVEVCTSGTSKVAPFARTRTPCPTARDHMPVGFEPCLGACLGVDRGEQGRQERGEALMTDMTTASGAATDPG
jgi:hypothetical protein